MVRAIKSNVWRNSDLKLSDDELRFFKERNSNNKQIAPKTPNAAVLKVGEGIIPGTKIIPRKDRIINHL